MPEREIVYIPVKPRKKESEKPIDKPVTDIPDDYDYSRIIPDRWKVK